MAKEDGFCPVRSRALCPNEMGRQIQLSHFCSVCVCVCSHDKNLCSCTCESWRLMLGISFDLFHLIPWSRVLQLNPKLANKASLRLAGFLWWCPVSFLWGWNYRHAAMPKSIYLSSGDPGCGPHACSASALTTEQSPHLNTSNVK